MEFLSKAWEGISSAFSNITSSVGNFFSSFGGGGGSGFSGGMGAAPPSATPGFAPPQVSAAPVSYGPQQSQGITYPQYQTNVYNPQSVQNQGLNILGQGAQRVADSIGGVGGRMVGILAGGAVAVAGAGMGQDAKIAAAMEREAMWRANSQGAISMAPPGQPMGQMPNMRGQFGANAGGNLSDRLIQAKHDGAAAMMARSVNQAQTELWRSIIPAPTNAGGAFGKLFGRR